MVAIPVLPTIGLYTLTSILFMDWVNTYAYERVPESLPPLPDLGFDLIPASSSSFYAADIVTISLFIFCALIGLKEGKTHLVQLRQLLAVYAFILNLRTITIISTTLPICYSHGPCREMHLPLQSRWITALAYAFALGFAVPGVVQCGDYIFSGHTVFIWILTLHLIKISRPSPLVKTLLYSWAIIGSLTIISFRRHYTIDIVVAVIVTFFVWQAFHLKLALIYAKGGAMGVESYFDALMLWIGGPSSLNQNLINSGNNNNNNAGNNSGVFLNLTFSALPKSGNAADAISEQEAKLPFLSSPRDNEKNGDNSINNNNNNIAANNNIVNNDDLEMGGGVHTPGWQFGSKKRGE